jgi:hypothetical protein
LHETLGLMESQPEGGRSFHTDLSRLTPAQIDRLEQGFQEAITDDRRLHRFYINLGVLYASLAK